MENVKRILELLAETLQRIDRHNEEIERLGKEFDQSALEQQQAYQAMTELLMYHNRILAAKEIL